MKFRTKILLIFGMMISFLTGSPILAKTWQVFNVASGLPSNRVTSFSYFSKWLAVGTDAGLAMYNGYDCRWEVPALPQEIASSPVKDLAFDEDGGLWVANAIGLLHIVDGSHRVYTTADGLPDADVDRIQMVRGSIIVGCFGGYIAHARLPGGGKTRFNPVNYDDGINLKISSVGISALCFSDAFNGWYGSLGNGLGKINGRSDLLLKHSDGMLGDWINDLWGFTSKQKETRHIVVSPEGLTFLKNGNIDTAFAPLKKQPWLTSVITVRNPDYVYEAFVEAKDNDEQTTYLKDFLANRSLYLGSKDAGIWRFQKGSWENYHSGNSSLPSDQINRLYVMKRFIVAATDGGLVLIPVDSQQNDEFKYCAIGTPYSKTFFSPPPIVQPYTQYFQVLRNIDYWFVHEKGISRFRTKGFLTAMANESEESKVESFNSNARLEESSLEISKSDADFSGLFADDNNKNGDNWRWQLFSKETFRDSSTEVYPIYSEKVTKAVADRANQCLWIIFDQKYLCRMWIRKKESKQKKRVLDIPEWEFILEDAPWPSGTALTTLWLDRGKLYVGTHGRGFYLLINPEAVNRLATPFDWQHYGDKEGLPFNVVTGFARWNSAGTDYLALLHPRSVSTWDGKTFGIVEMGGLEKYTCIAADQIGNLWVGSKAGLFRITPEGSRKEYTSFNSDFESNNITAIAVPPMNSSRICGVWVACDDEAEMADDGRIWDGLDEPPMAIRQPLSQSEQTNYAGNNNAYPVNKIKLVEQAIDGGSLHFFNGTVWEKWSYAGVNCIMVENDYIWLSSNLRIRRIRLAR